MITQPLVAIKCLVYNHEPYLRDCFEGFVMQQTSFPFVAIVHDDASTDKSADIIREYTEKYPDIFRPIYEIENQYSKGDGSLNRIMNAAIDATGAKYVAMCEGDDYWTDPKKLQKQVDFLEANPEYSMCFHRVKVISDFGDGNDFFAHLKEKDYTAAEMFERWTVPTCSVLYREDVFKAYYRVKSNLAFGDIYLWLSLAKGGKVHCQDFVAGVYRRHSGGASVNISLETRCRLVDQYRMMARCFPEVRDIARKQEDNHLRGLIYEKWFPGIWKYRFRYMLLHPKLFFSSFFTTTLTSYTFHRARHDK
jgi:glycosyltransferase involved in cell wall biosynthesis